MREALRSWVQPLRLSLVFVGGVIGAGFASGAELRTYFVRYGTSGLAGMVLAILLLAGAAWGFLHLARERGLTSFAEAAQLLAGEKGGAALDTVVTAFLLISLGVMLAGAGEVLAQLGALPRWVGASLMGMATFVALCRGSRGLVAVNMVIGPFLIFGIVLLAVTAVEDWVSAATLLTEPLVLEAGTIRLLPALLSGLLYASYNMVGAAAVLCGLGTELESLPAARRTALLGGFLLGGLILAAGLATFLNYDTIEAVSIPAFVILRLHPVRQTLYGFVLIGAMYTTAVSDGFGLLCRLQSLRQWPRWCWSLLIVAGAYGIASIGFGRLVEQGYPIFGCIGLGQLILLVRYYIP